MLLVPSVVSHGYITFSSANKLLVILTDHTEYRIFLGDNFYKIITIETNGHKKKLTETFSLGYKLGKQP